MLRFVIAVLAVSYASGALHGICHSNHLQMIEKQVVNQLADICDRDSNTIIRESEVVVGFSEILGTTCLLGIASLFGFSVVCQDFIHSWHARFHDNHEFIGATFDSDHDGTWTIQEVDGILNHMKASVDDGDGVISRTEFVNYFTAIYKNC